ncbi:putative polysaccharide biosynthesis protein [Moraxella macacae 0408225]|uniref:Putative polysaccharide biosynthesis protein n=1 Tax=Moraxella macacae 0408225 TaxID=1230338 RepID=L2F5T4_9GAMM|nr:oligosaccharide flippase family protein [Moraxella macacae]ELA08392.1 putative polysaccharide biosynthesis protein [Moraxella macacae 0408225]
MRLLKDSVIYVAGEVLAKATPFLLLPYLTRTLGVDGFGELSYYLSLVAFLLIAMGLSQNSSISRYYYVYGKQGLGNVLLVGGLYGFVWLMLGAVLSLLVGNELLWYCFSMAFLQTLLQNQLALRQCQKLALHYFGIQITLSMTNLLLTVILFNLFSHDVKTRLVAINLAYLFTCMMAFLLAKRQFKLTFRPTYRRLSLAMRYLLGLGLPLLLHVLSYTMKGQLDRVLIYQQFSEHKLGIYAAGVQVASSLSVVIMAINTATIPYLYENLKNKRMTLAKLQYFFWLGLGMVPVITVIAWLIPEAVYAWLLGADFIASRYYTLVFVLAFALTIPYLVLVNFLFYHGKNQQISTCSVLSTLVYLLALWLFSQIKLSYIPFASVLSNLAILPLLYYFTIKVNKT